MMRLIVILSIVLFGCKATKPMVTTVIKDSIVTQIKTEYHTDTLLVKGDTVEVTESIPCPDVKIERWVTKGNTKLAYSINNGWLNINCHTDEWLHIIDSLETKITTIEGYHSKVDTVIKEVELIKYKVPKWCWILLSLNVLQVCWYLRKPILKLVTKT
jgi:hypothetical protein